MRRTILLLGLIGSLACFSCGNERVCGESTVEKNGVCVGSGITIGPENCAMGTKLENGRCVPASPPTMCDPIGTYEEVDPITGVVTCLPNCGDPPCLGEIACPQAAVGKSTYCGYLVDASTGDKVALAASGGSGCDPAQPTVNGPCALRLMVYEATDFVASPATAIELVPEEIYVDACGSFRIVNVATPPSGQLVLVTDSYPGASDPLYLRTATIAAAQSAQSKNNVPLYAVSGSAELSWSQTAGVGSPGFAERGAYLGIFTDNSVPLAGVTMTREGAAVTADDYYFADTSLSSRLVIDPDQDETGLNGSGLVINSPLSTHAGTGPVGLTCNWRSVTAATVPGVVFVQNHTCGP